MSYLLASTFITVPKCIECNYTARVLSGAYSSLGDVSFTSYHLWPLDLQLDVPGYQGKSG